MDKFLQVSFCCNDGSNGAFRHVFDGIQVHSSDGAVLSGDCLMLDEDAAPSLEFGATFLRVAGVVYPKRGFRRGEGNWCWDGVEMTVRDTQLLLCQLKKLGFWFENEGGDFPELADMIEELES